jgi:hypothetical protein
MQKKNNPIQTAALLSAQEFLSGLPADAPAPVRQYAVGRVVALGGKPAKSRPAKLTKKLAAPAPPTPAPPTPAPPTPAPAPAPIPPAPSAFAVATARATIAQADAAVAAARKTELVAQLVEVRKLLSVKAPRLAALCINLLELQAQGANIDVAIVRRREKITELLATTPECASWLPNDPEVLAHRAQIARYEDEIAQLHAAGAALPIFEQEVLAAVILQDEVRRLHWTQGSIVNRLDALSGRKLIPWGGKSVGEGGLFGAF